MYVELSFIISMSDPKKQTLQYSTDIFFFSFLTQMLGECGLCLALDKEVVECKKGGILTTAVAMGMPLIKRLNDAGMTFKVLEDEQTTK